MLLDYPGPSGRVRANRRVHRAERRGTIPDAAADMNLPNSLTLARIVLVPLLVVVLLTTFEGHRVLGLSKGVAAAIIFAVASLTDWLDGYLARRRQQVTILGQLLDPIADKLLITAALVSLVQLNLASAWMVAIIIGRELAVTGLRGVAQARGLTMPASGLGKLKMAAQVVAVLVLMLAPEIGGEVGAMGVMIGRGALWVVLALALWSAVEYYQTFADVIAGRSGLDAAAKDTADSVHLPAGDIAPRL